MKGTLQWYVWGTGRGVATDVLACCAAAGLSLGHRVTGRVTYLDQEGVQVEVAEDELAPTIERQLAGDSTLFDFSFDGLTPDEARATAEMLFAARRQAGHPTALWLVDFVGLGFEYGPAHVWDGGQAPYAVPPAE